MECPHWLDAAPDLWRQAPAFLSHWKMSEPFFVQDFWSVGFVWYVLFLFVLVLFLILLFLKCWYITVFIFKNYLGAGVGLNSLVGKVLLM